jgi:hypothetical protein
MKPHVAQGLPNTEFDDQSIGQETDLIDWTGFSDAWPYFSPSLSRIDDNPSSTDQWNNAGLSDASAPEGPRITDGQPGGLSAGPANPDAFGATGATAAQLRLAVGDSGLTVTGAGIKIGVLSDSFDNLGGAAADVADGALPAGVTVLEDLASGGTDEGRAIMQIVHDIAPGASLYFHTAFSGEQDFANGILALAAAGCKVICDDVSYFDEPFFQNGVVAQAIQTVEQEGVVYVTAAGNDAGNAYQAARHTACDAIIEMAYPRAKAYRQVPLMIRERLAARAAALYGEYASELPIFRQLANIGEQRGIGVTGGK